MTEPQQPAAPLEVDDPEPAPPEPNPTLEAPPALEPRDIDQSPAIEASQALEEESADDAPPAAETESLEPDERRQFERSLRSRLRRRSADELVLRLPVVAARGVRT